MLTFPNITKQHYESVRSEIQTGDILLASGDYLFSRMIQFTTSSCWSHVAFILRLEQIDRVMVLESVENKGVRTIPLSEYVKNFEGKKHGYNGRLAIARYDDFSKNVSEQQLQALAKFAIERFSYPYDYREMIRIIYRIFQAKLHLPIWHMVHDNSYICSEYVYECYRKIPITIKRQNPGFVSPNDFAEDKNIKLLFELIK